MIRQFVYIYPVGIHKTEVMLDKLIAEITTRLQKSPDYDLIKDLKVEEKLMNKDEFGVVFSLSMDHARFESSTYFLFTPKDYSCNMSFDIQVVSDKIEAGDVLYLDTFVEKAEPGVKYEVNFETLKTQIAYVLMKKNHIYNAYYGWDGVDLCDITKFAQLAESLGLAEFPYLKNVPYKLVEDFDDCTWTLNKQDIQKMGKHFGLENDFDFPDEDAYIQYLEKLNKCLEEYEVRIGVDDLSVFPINDSEPYIECDTKKTYTFESVSNGIVVNDEYWLFTAVDLSSVEDWIKINKVY